METRVGLIGIIVEDYENIDVLNSLLHSYSEFILGRMGIPHTAKAINLISIAVDAPMDIINALSDKIKNIEGITAKIIYADK